jgi:uncharacterized protein YgiB involved in biofilm formation
MKKSRHIQVATLSILGLAACSTKQAALPDPCRPETYNDIACQDAVKNHGYYSHGVFVYGNYPDPYLSYYQRYQAFTAQGGVPTSVPLDAYSAHGNASADVSRGGFGDSAHAAGA